ncbi:MAG: hypothetical protein OET44_16760 [Gammaproteobacteria bacterium]|nr:hypothetical protein [Gammaproteobacteria bacterium]
MSEFLSALSWVLACNLWVAIGCVALVVAIDRGIVERPQSLIHSIVWMCLWPLLAIKGLRALVSSHPSPTVSGRPSPTSSHSR